MAYDAVTTAAIADELRDHLLDGRVDKVIQPSELAVALFIRAGGANRTLLLSAHPQQARATLTAQRLAKAFDEPSPFVMLLRKYLEGAGVVAVEQAGRDRILRFTVRTRLHSVTLIAEIMGKHSNIILVDDQDNILGAIKRITPAQSRYRAVLPHQPYITPPPQMQPPPHQDRPKLDPLSLSPHQLADALADHADAQGLADALLDVLTGVSPQLAKETAYRLIGESCVTLGAARGQLDETLATVQGLMAPERWEPSIVEANGKILGWAAYPLLQHGIAPERYGSMMEVLDRVYSGTESHDPLGSARAALRAVLEGHRARIAKKAASLRAGLRPQEEIDLLRLQGEMVLAFAHQIEPGQRELHLDEPRLTIPLDPLLSPSENAQTFFARYRKARDAQDKVPPLLEEAEAALQFLDDALIFVEQAASAQELKEIQDDVLAAGFSLPGAKEKRPQQKGKGGTYHPGGKQPPSKKAAPALRLSTRDGLEILVGKSARQNEIVTFDLASSGDLWLHARGLPGSHVVLKTGGRTPPDSSIEAAAAVAAYYSSGRAGTTVPVDVVPVRNVRRIKGGKPGLVRFTGETTITVHPRPEP